jgi:hypothetical protein
MNEENKFDYQKYIRAVWYLRYVSYQLDLFVYQHTVEMEVHL